MDDIDTVSDLFTATPDSSITPGTQEQCWKSSSDQNGAHNTKRSIRKDRIDNGRRPSITTQKKRLSSSGSRPYQSHYRLSAEKSSDPITRTALTLGLTTPKALSLGAHTNAYTNGITKPSSRHTAPQNTQGSGSLATQRRSSLTSSSNDPPPAPYSKGSNIRTTGTLQALLLSKSGMSSKLLSNPAGEKLGK
jgi:hypothetical protein